MQTGALAQSYARAFERLGVDVVRFDSERALQSQPYSGNRILRRVTRASAWNAVNREALNVARDTKPALIFAVKCTFFHAETIREIRRLTGAPFVNYYPDNPYIGLRLDPREASALRRDLIEVFRQYTMVFMWEHSLLQRLQSDGVEARYVPFAVDPELFQPQAVSPGLYCESCAATHDVGFVATYSRSRCAEVSAIRRHAIGIWGGNWPRRWRTLTGQHRAHPAVWGSAVSGIYARATLSLNVLNAESLEGHNMRTFEIPASGGVMLARYTAAQDELFPENEAAAYYRSPSEMDDKIDALLGDPDLCARLRRNALRLAAANTYDERAAAVLRECELAAPNQPVLRRTET
jgi:spore maturation protein CgeB